MIKNYVKEFLADDLFSSVVVFLVALPLCMGIALASGVEPIVGILSGIVGGIVVGIFAGCPLQVSGPAAGLTVMIFSFVEKFGVSSLVPLGIIVGIFQMLLFKFKLAPYFRAISPLIIRGMLAGIGGLILISQLHVSVASKVKGGNGLQKLFMFPKVFIDNVITNGMGAIPLLVTLLALVIILGWQNFFPKISKKFPAPLLAIIVSAIACQLFAFQVDFVAIPDDLLSEINFVNFNSFDNFSVTMLLSALSIGFVASIESLLSVNAVDKLTKGDSNYNKEIFAQGLGNFVIGLVGAIPLTGVIVRSSANIASGGKTRGSAIMHGIWLMLLVFCFPKLLAYVPIPALAAILILTGLKLLNIKGIIAQVKTGDRFDSAVFAVTLGLILGTDLLTGVLFGFIASLLVLMLKTFKLEVQEFKGEVEGEMTYKFYGKATFLHIPQISTVLYKSMRESKKITLDLSNLQYLDDSIKEEVFSFKDKLGGKDISASVVLPSH